jgi:ABC-2 type transport system permease protein
MRSVLALMRASYLTAASYKLALVLSFSALLVSVAPLYFISGALQPVVADSIAREGGDYFGFLLVGLGAMYAVTMAVGALPSALQGSIGSGTLESLLVTRTPLPHVLLGLVGYPVLQGALRGLVLLGGGAIAGVEVEWAALPLAAVVVALLVAAYLAFGLVGGALILLFRTAGPLGTAVIAVSGLLGGVYYSTTVIPAWLQDLSGLVPLTYGLRALRMLLLGGAPFAEVANDLSILTMQAVLMLAAAGALFAAALRRARIAGTLSQY